MWKRNRQVPASTKLTVSTAFRNSLLPELSQIQVPSSATEADSAENQSSQHADNFVGRLNEL